jgi:hypothetical protein
MTRTPHADFYALKGLVVSNHPELLEFITEAEKRYCHHDALVSALQSMQEFIDNLYAMKDRNLILKIEAANPGLSFGYVKAALPPPVEAAAGVET